MKEEKQIFNVLNLMDNGGNPTASDKGNRHLFDQCQADTNRWNKNPELHYDYLRTNLKYLIAHPHNMFSFEDKRRQNSHCDRDFARLHLCRCHPYLDEELVLEYEKKAKNKYRTYKRKYLQIQKRNSKIKKKRQQQELLDFPYLLLKLAKAMLFTLENSKQIVKNLELKEEIDSLEGILASKGGSAASKTKKKQDALKKHQIAKSHKSGCMSKL